jgi:hypothetical protein
MRVTPLATKCHRKRELGAILWSREMVTHAMNFLRLEDSSVSALWVFFRRFISPATSIASIEIDIFSVTA